MQNRRNRSYVRSLPARKQSRTLARFNTKYIVWAGFVVFVGFWLLSRGNKATPLTVEARTAPVQPKQQKPQQAPFPTLDTSSFTSTQQKMFSVMKEEYAKEPTSYDKTVLEYTEGARESWCADFISVVRFLAGKPFENSETGYWRIPGVETLRDYYAKSDAYHLVGTYTPKFGDVAFYFGETPDGSSQEHVAFVLEVRGSTLVTLGGNETSKGILQIRTNKLSAGEKGLAGFGESSL